jgi:hypothetical protein
MLHRCARIKPGESILINGDAAVVVGLVVVPLVLLLPL